MKAIHLLISYGLHHGLISEAEINYVNNRISHYLKIEPSIYQEIKYKKEPLEKIFKPIFEVAVNNKVIEDSLEAKDNFEALIMDLFTPRPDDVINKFDTFMKKDQKIATGYLYNLMIRNNYIKEERVSKNHKYQFESKYGTLEITINVSKPEKDNKAIEAALKNSNNFDYPRCVLCQENVGYYGRNNFNGRSNHRLIPLKLNKEDFYFHYSPYVYYQEHAIVLSKVHTPMLINKKTLIRLFDFVDQFPGYFLGSNAGLPIVGGTILNHEHYQGGRYHFPIENASSFKDYQVKDVKVSLLNWPLSTIRLESSNREALITLGDKIRVAFEKYLDKAANIIPFTGKVPHNTITPIVRIKGGVYELDIALRNNRTDKTYPDGIFHNHPEVHDVKKEGIGLIEVMGLAILPGRLATDIPLIEQYLDGKIKTFDRIQMYPNLINRLKERNVLNKKIIETEVGAMFVQGLEHCGVFKQSKEGQDQFKKFVESII